MTSALEFFAAAICDWFNAGCPPFACLDVPLRTGCDADIGLRAGDLSEPIGVEIDGRRFLWRVERLDGDDARVTTYRFREVGPEPPTGTAALVECGLACPACGLTTAHRHSYPGGGHWTWSPKVTTYRFREADR
jgi:hypothetical protein